MPDFLRESFLGLGFSTRRKSSSFSMAGVSFRSNARLVSESGPVVCLRFKSAFLELVFGSLEEFKSRSLSSFRASQIGGDILELHIPHSRISSFNE